MYFLKMSNIYDFQKKYLLFSSKKVSFKIVQFLNVFLHYLLNSLINVNNFHYFHVHLKILHFFHI